MENSRGSSDIGVISDSGMDCPFYEKVKNENIDILINNAGFGLFGDFTKTDLQRELEMIDLNIKI